MRIPAPTKNCRNALVRRLNAKYAPASYTSCSDIAHSSSYAILQVTGPYGNSCSAATCHHLSSAEGETTVIALAEHKPNSDNIAITTTRNKPGEDTSLEGIPYLPSNFYKR